MVTADQPTAGAFPWGVRLVLGLAWPIVVLTLALIFRGPLASVFDMRGKQSMDLEASPTGLKIAIQSAVNAAAATRDQGGPGKPVSPEAVSRITDTATSAVADGRILSGRQLLWVDDNPANNSNLSAAFETLGAEVTTALSNDDALAKLKTGRFDLIITDVGRAKGAPDGLQILPELKAAAPVAIYSASFAAQHRGEEKALGAREITNDPSELYVFVVDLLRR